MADKNTNFDDIEKNSIRQLSADGEGRFWRSTMPGIGFYYNEGGNIPLQLRESGGNYKQQLGKLQRPKKFFTNSCVLLILVMIVLTIAHFVSDESYFCPVALFVLPVFGVFVYFENKYIKKIKEYESLHPEGFDFDGYENPQIYVPHFVNDLYNLDAQAENESGIKKDILKNYVMLFRGEIDKENRLSVLGADATQADRDAFARFCNVFDEYRHCSYLKFHTASDKVSGNIKSVNTSPVYLFLGTFGAIQSDFDIPVIQYKDKNALYFYPDFMIMGTDMFDFQVFDYSDITFTSDYVNWHTKLEHSDSQHIGYKEEESLNVYKFSEIKIKFGKYEYGITSSNYDLGCRLCNCLMLLATKKTNPFFYKYSSILNGAYALYSEIANDRQVQKRVQEIFDDGSASNIFHNIRVRLFADLYRQIKIMGGNPDAEIQKYEFLYNVVLRMGVFDSGFADSEFILLSDYKRFTAYPDESVKVARNFKQEAVFICLHHILNHFKVKQSLVEKAISQLYELLKVYAEYRKVSPEASEKVLERVANYGKSVRQTVTDSGNNSEFQTIDSCMTELENYLQIHIENLRLASKLIDYSFNGIAEWNEFNIGYRLNLLAITDFAVQYSRMGHSLDFSTNEGKFLRRVIGTASVTMIGKMFQLARNYENRLLVSDLMAKADISLKIINGYQLILKKLLEFISKVDGKVVTNESVVINFVEKYNPYSEDGIVSHGSGKSATELLNELIGMKSVKDQLTNIQNFVNIQKVRRDSGLQMASQSYHCLFTGNPGTGKTTVARIIAKIHKELGTLTIGHLVEADRASLVGGKPGESSAKTNALIDSAMGGILFIDEAYTICGDDDAYGREALDIIIKRMEDDRDRLIVIMAGYPKEMESLLEKNPGLRSRFNTVIEFPDYTTPELLEIFRFYLKNTNYCADDKVFAELSDYFDKIKKRTRTGFGNAREVRNVFEKAIQNQASRISKQKKSDDKQIKATDLDFLKSVSAPKNTNARKQLDGLIGLENVKIAVRKLQNFLKIQKLRKENGLPCPEVSYHCVFSGNPGTGKTTVARILGEVYAEMGIIQSSKLIETSRAGLVGELVGQTAPKTNAVIDKALGGVLFIDEAYTLYGDEYGKEAIDTILKRMEDERGNLIVILAGYPEDMELLINSNPGLKSRFGRFIHFPDYSADELMEIFGRLMDKGGFRAKSETLEALRKYFAGQIRYAGRSFGNARFVRNIYERAIENLATRLQNVANPSGQDFATIELPDLGIN